MKTLEKIVAERLVALKAIKLQPISPFKWGNGWNSPIYCDDRRGLSYPKERDFLKLELSRIVAEQFPETDVIAGIATNAIAHGVLVAHQLLAVLVGVGSRQVALLAVLVIEFEGPVQLQVFLRVTPAAVAVGIPQQTVVVARQHERHADHADEYT